jgi:tetratricopeptide (TPR) repeat protein
MSVLRGKWLTGVAPVLTAAVLAASCAAPVPRQPELGTGGVSAEMLLEASPLSAGAPDDLGAVDILEVTPEMVAFLEARIEGVDNRYARLKRLVDGIMGEENFELVYDDSTRTAAGTFKERRGNCLSFTNMFIAMARQAGIHAEYQEVDIPPDWSIAGDSFLFSQHVNANVDLGAGVIRIVDFNIYDFHTSYDRRVISDQRARAHYFSNIGVDYMLAGDAAQAYGNYRQAILEEPSFEPAWINLGILHRREGFPAHAEAAYLKALELEPSNMVAMSNLANLYDEAGEGCATLTTATGWRRRQ